MKKLLIATTLILSISNSYATQYGYFSISSDCNGPDALACGLAFLTGGVLSSTTSTFNPTAGVVLMLDNGEKALNTAAPEVQDALEKEELGLELNELDMAILDKLDELNL